MVRPAARALRPVTAAFLAVAILSSGIVVSLGWLLLRQDRELDQARRDERHTQAADRFAARMQPVLSDPASLASSAPPDTLLLTIDDAGVAAAAGTLLYYPHETPSLREPPDDIFAEGERLEYAIQDFAAAERVYASFTTADDSAVRAGALGRLARVQRKRGNFVGAIATYDRLASTPEAIGVEGFPATLHARLGRAAALEETGRDAVEPEARALWTDLRNGRWPMSVAEFAARKQEVRQWLGTEPVDDSDRPALAQAAEWLWQNRQSLTSPGYRRVTLPTTEVIAVWTPSGGQVRAAIAGPRHVEALLANVNTESVSRRNVLGAALAAVAVVLLAGWYFILRSLSRERRALELQSDFVAAVSHEFRSPLTSMTHVAEMLEGGRVPAAAERTSYGMLVRDSHRLRRLVEDLLDFRRFESGSAAMRLEPLNVLDLVCTTAADFQAHAAPSGYVIDVKTPDEPVHVAGDRDALTRALWNLLDNAVKYSPHCRTVWVSVAREAGRIAIAVRDHGIGIPDDEQHRVFERFARGADARALRIKGTGIGLAIVRHIVRAHGGEVSLASKPGSGSRFTLWLPDAAEGVS